MDSDNSHFYIGEHPIIDEREQPTKIGQTEILPNYALIKFKLVEIANRRSHPLFHFEIDGKMYFYGILRVLADGKIILRCQKRFLRSKCNS